MKIIGREKMETGNLNKEEKYYKAKKRVEQLKKYYTHLVVYVVVNLFVSVKKIVRNLDNGETFQEAFFDLGTFILWIFWGIGIIYHTFNVFGFDFLLGKNWERNKIEEFMSDRTI
ncbi:2TM domain-containing protein [Tenacibaculum sp. 190524A02b]|uniref:2TM domain-containing protein n=1 Tax=Tenacibaculum vairaonense TaxID=3137860 RepID=UPI0031FB822E